MVLEENRIMMELISKEEQLLENDIRNDAQRLAEILDDRYVEFTPSGERNRHRAGGPLEMTSGVSYIDSKNVSLIDLAEDCKILLYVAVKVSKNVRIKSNCSSVWKKTGGNWKIVFHQGTACAVPVPTE